MGKVAIENIEIGMVLASDVHDRSGRLLLGTGVELTQKHLLIFRTWGILDADILGLGNDQAVDQIPANIDLEQLADAEHTLAPLFRYTNRSHPAMIELMRLAALRKVQHGAI